MSRRDAAGTAAPGPQGGSGLPGGPAQAPSVALTSAPAQASGTPPLPAPGAAAFEPATSAGAAVSAISSVPAGRRAWLALAALLGAGALLAFALPASLIERLDGQPALWLAQPWRLWTAAWVHWTPLHLAANVVGLLALALYGCAAEVKPRAALAWLLAWPLTHLALALWTALPHYGGLSGVLHAGVAVASTSLLARRGRQRAVGAAVWAGLLVKLWAESPWWPWSGASAGTGSMALDVAVAPQAHAAGVVAGLLCALAVEMHDRQKNKP